MWWRSTGVCRGSGICYPHYVRTALPLPGPYVTRPGHAQANPLCNEPMYQTWIACSGMQQPRNLSVRFTSLRTASIYSRFSYGVCDSSSSGLISVEAMCAWYGLNMHLYKKKRCARRIAESHHRTTTVSRAKHPPINRPSTLTTSLKQSITDGFQPVSNH
jgi:hypothetical protein